MKNLIKLKMLLFSNITFVTYLMKLVNVYSVPHLCGQNKQLVCLFKIQIPVAACSVFYEWLSLTFLFTKHPAEGLFQNQLELCSLEWHVPIPACVWDLGHVIHFPSPAIRPHIPRPGYFSTRDSTPFPECRRFYCFSFLIFFFFFPCSWTNASCSASCMPRGSSSPGLGKCAGSVFYFPTLCISLECELLSQAVFMAEGAVGEVPSLLPWQPRWMMFSAGPGDLVL